MTNPKDIVIEFAGQRLEGFEGFLGQEFIGVDDPNRPAYQVLKTRVHADDCTVAFTTTRAGRSIFWRANARRRQIRATARARKRRRGW